MKTLVIYFILVLGAGIGNAQEITELEEARVGFSPFSSNYTKLGNSYTFKINSPYVGEFEKNALAFMHENFEIKKFIAELKDENYDSYQISFRSGKGVLQADFDQIGNLVYTSQRFKNITVPNALAHQLYRDYKGWTIARNIYVASGKNGKIDKEFYRITMKNGKQKKNLKIIGPVSQRIEVTNN